jgi:GR25 family glycosyltransferase involved in LPS biosynthesis
MERFNKYSIVYINLDRAPQRRKFMEKELERVGIEGAFRFSAIDANKEGALNQAGFSSGAGDRWTLPKSAIACFESHRAIWKLAVDQKLEAIVIFEDDVLLSDEIHDIISNLMASSKKFDVVKLDIGGSYAKCGITTKISSLNVRKLFARLSSAGAYILSYSGAKKLLARSKTYGDTVDDFIFSPSPDWNMYQLFPAAVSQVVNLDNSKGSLNYLMEHGVLEGEREKSPDFEGKKMSRGPFYFRIKKEFKRLVKKISWIFYGKNKLLGQGGYYGLIPLREDFVVKFSK